MKIQLPCSWSKYCRVCLRENGGKGKAITRYVHRLVLEAFVGFSEPGHECRHGDRDTTNNRLSNLSWGTRSQNAEDRRKHGTMPLGESHKKSKITDDIVRSIREMRKNGELIKDIAKRFGVTFGCVQGVLLGKVWKHVV